MKPGQVDVDTVDDATSHAIHLLAKALDVYETRQQKYSADRGNEPEPGSPASAAMGARELGRMPTTLFTQLDLLARDHLRPGIRVMLRWG